MRLINKCFIVLILIMLIYVPVTAGEITKDEDSMDITIEELENIVYTLPNEVVRLYDDALGYIWISDEYLSAELGDVAMSVSIDLDGLIFIKIYKDCPVESVKKYLLHEFGHVLDIYMGNEYYQTNSWSFDYNTWMDILCVTDFITPYAKAQPRLYNQVIEDFAESMRLYWENPKEFKINHQKRFDRIHKLVLQYMYKDLGKLMLNNYSGGYERQWE